MAKLFIEESTLTAIGDAIREKTGGSELINPLDMVIEIEGIGGIVPNEAFLNSGDCSHKFQNNGWNWFIENYGDKITTDKLTASASMFNGSTKLEEIPFDLNFDNSTYRDTAMMFQGCDKLKSIGTIRNFYPSSVSSLFSGCYNLRNLPTFENPNFDRLHSYAYAQIGSMFNNCHSLRSIPENILKELNVPLTTNSNQLSIKMFSQNYVLDELVGISPLSGNISTNAFTYCFDYMCRLKNIIFATQEDGTPYSVNWKNQIFDLTQYCGYFTKGWNDKVTYEKITDYNSGITMDKEVKDDATYQALKNDPDWFTIKVEYSRYNHDSAVATINSLPDTSAFGTNTIKFLGASGSATDGGAINTLTEEEIAVATAKGWQVQIV